MTLCHDQVPLPHRGEEWPNRQVQINQGHTFLTESRGKRGNAKIQLLCDDNSQKKKKSMCRKNVPEHNIGQRQGPTIDIILNCK